MKRMRTCVCIYKEAADIQYVMPAYIPATVQLHILCQGALTYCIELPAKTKWRVICYTSDSMQWPGVLKNIELLLDELAALVGPEAGFTTTRHEPRGQDLVK